MRTWFMPFCQWLQNTSVAVWIAGSDRAYPFVQLTHLTGLSLWIGAPEPPALAKFVGLTELLVWLAVATLAVPIPYFSQRDSMPLDFVNSTWSMQRL
jgi:hypothetical protein